jgi:8-oxo-dGTP pyrophosphatase MutT (NUDIX family)
VPPRKLPELLLDPEAASRIEVRGAVPAAVLVALYRRKGELYTVLTERHNDLSRHAGEISFPGGRRDPQDPDLVATALREADEEIGLPPDKVKIVGGLQPTPTMVTGYAIYPFVGMIPASQKWRPNGGEVEQVLELSLPALTAGYERRRIVRRGMPIWTDTYVVDEHLVWGATARILADLLERVAKL